MTPWDKIWLVASLTAIACGLLGAAGVAAGCRKKRSIDALIANLEQAVSDRLANCSKGPELEAARQRLRDAFYAGGPLMPPATCGTEAGGAT